MNNLKKLGVTALAGSLAAVSAQAGEMSMNGSANMTYYTTSKSEGKGIGTDKGLTVSGSGADTIDGETQVQIESPYGALSLYTNGSHWFIY